MVPEAGQSTSELTERALLRAVAAADRGALKRLVALYTPRLFAYVFRMLNEASATEEVVNDTLFEVWRQAGSFRAQSRVSTWIFGIARYRALTAIRARPPKRSGAGELEDEIDFDEMESGDPGPEAAAEQSETRAQVAAALDHLSPPHREVIELTFYHGFTCEEIGDIVGCPANTVKTRMFHARARLRDLLAQTHS